MTLRTEWPGAILAGGRSRRFGTDKALAEIDGIRMIERVRTTLRQVAREVVVVVDRAGRFGERGWDTIVDERGGGGPLSGLHAALRWADARGAGGALVAPCDVPLITPGVFVALAARASRGDVDVVVPESRGPAGVEPLCAWYSTAALDEVARRIASNERSMRGLLTILRVGRVRLEELLRIGEPAVLFLNVNTPADLERAECAAHDARPRAGESGG